MIDPKLTDVLNKLALQEEHIQSGTGSSSRLITKAWHEFTVGAAKVGQSHAGNWMLTVDLLEVSTTTDSGKTLKDYLLHAERLSEFSQAVGVDCTNFRTMDTSLLLDLPIKAYVIHQPWKSSDSRVEAKMTSRISRYARSPKFGQKQDSSIPWVTCNSIPELQDDGTLPEEEESRA